MCEVNRKTRKIEKDIRPPSVSKGDGLVGAAFHALDGMVYIRTVLSRSLCLCTVDWNRRAGFERRGTEIASTLERGGLISSRIIPCRFLSTHEITGDPASVKRPMKLSVPFLLAWAVIAHWGGRDLLFRLLYLVAWLVEAVGWISSVLRRQPT